jgi:hypothetical protein
LNKRQKEILQHQLDAEKEVLDKLKKQYQRALWDIDIKIRVLQSDELTQSRIYRLEYQKVLKKQVEAVLEKLHADEYTTIQQFLSDTYTDAFVGTAYDMFGQGVPLILPIDRNAAVKAVVTDSQISEGLYESLGVDTKKLKNSISAEITRGIASGLPHSQIAQNIASYAKAPLGRAKTIVRTESHRIAQASAMDAQKVAVSKGAKVVKQWMSTLDGDTRKSHRKLDGQIREIEEPFEMDGKKAMYPGDFGDPAEDCNCRCQLLQRARIALDEDELKTLQERAKFFDLDKTADFEDFKKKYLKSADIAHLPLEKSVKSGKIEVGRFNTIADPMREVTGAGMISHPKEISAIITELKEYNVEVSHKGTDMAYAPGLFFGSPGQFKIDEEASYSAWMHEYKHFCDDRDDGFLGMRVFMDTEKCIKREVDAYNVEIELAKQAGRPDIVERLEELKANEVSRYGKRSETD